MHEQALEKFGKYLLLDRIGKGGMAGIFRARPASADANGRIMVIKRLLPQVASNPEFMSMFRTETQVCMAFNHPNLVQIHDFGDVGTQSYIAMEYVEGKNLKELVVAFSKENEHVPMEMAVNVIEQAARGLHYAHVFKNNATGEKLNLIHRDVSPHNILLSYDGNVKVIDFGIAKAEIDTYDVTRDGLIKGKVGYLSPEQVGGKKLDARSDIFALGIVLWELLTGRRLFIVPGQSDLAILQSIQHCDQYVAPPSSVNHNVPDELDLIVIRALAQDPAMRYATAEEFAAALKKFMNTKFPEYGTGEVSAKLRQLFHNEIEDDHRWLRDLNQKAQEGLTFGGGAKSPFLSDEMSGGAYPTPPPMASLSMSVSSASSHSLSPIPMAHAAMATPPPLPSKRKFLTRGRAIGAVIYVLTILLIKMDERYYFFERFMLSTDDVKVLTQTRAPVVARPKAQQRATASATQSRPTSQAQNSAGVPRTTPPPQSVGGRPAPMSDETRAVPTRGTTVMGKTLRNI